MWKTENLSLPDCSKFTHYVVYELARGTGVIFSYQIFILQHMKVKEKDFLDIKPNIFCFIFVLFFFLIFVLIFFLFLF
jgi:hypothetical protein